MKRNLAITWLGNNRTSSVMVMASVCLGLTTGALNARPIPQNLAGGLDKLVESNITLKEQSAKGLAPSALYGGYATQAAANYASLAIQEEGTRRFLVDIHPSGRVPLTDLLSTLQAKFASFTLTAVDSTYKGVGVVEGYISLDDVPALGKMREVRSVQLGLRPELNKPAANGGHSIQPGTVLPLLGTVSDQGVYQHRVDQINKFYNSSARLDLEGSGISIGLISDSIGSVTTDVNNFDLPGGGR